MFESVEAHIFDCTSLSDEVLATIGQAFTLAQRASEARRAQRKAQAEAAAATGAPCLYLFFKSLLVIFVLSHNSTPCFKVVEETTV